MAKTSPHSDPPSTCEDHEDGNFASSDQEEEHIEPSSSSIPNWLDSLALFGDSSWALAMSFCLMLLAIFLAGRMEDGSADSIFSWVQDLWKSINEPSTRDLGPLPKLRPPHVYPIDHSPLPPPLTLSDKPSAHDRRIVTNEMIQAFQEDGVIAIRGLLHPDLLDRLDPAADELVGQQITKNAQKPKGPLTGKPKAMTGTQFLTVLEGAMFHHLETEIPNNYTNATPTITLPPFLQVAMYSDVPQVAAELLNLTTTLDDHESLRIMRDIFLAKDADEYICGWHVDDVGFWPATADADGVNAWIALNDMPVQGGGSFALAVQSHVAPWRYDAYRVTGSTHFLPQPDGFQSAADMLERRTGNGTCNIATAAPDLHQRMEDTKRIYALQRGDVIFHTRWLFHRTVPFEPTSDDKVYRRYSIRYGPGSSEIPNGWGTEPSVLWDPENGGRTADQVSQLDAAWYPQVWPAVVAREVAQMAQIAQERLPSVKEKANVRRKQLRQSRRASSSQRRHPQRQTH